MTPPILYRAAQEAPHNVAEHANARRIRVAICREDGHLALRGRLTITSQRQQGTQIRNLARLPGA